MGNNIGLTIVVFAIAAFVLYGMWIGSQQNPMGDNSIFYFIGLICGVVMVLCGGSIISDLLGIQSKKNGER